ncbi:Putative hydrolase/esterase [Candidatus Fokinia solitaria]|uniref:Hydrolase/esterase n=1 Tax=Candidatus Fokinia solitaria TaxID=1802984 RepID=A0A2U8BSF8_9RICK|nr:serine hydrolase domain-containing protein [Candidatus Fokinia solitaria]AWD33296.1 Putative hydrolase/esterase [Candidatus Fokinia solitaria]
MLRDSLIFFILFFLCSASIATASNDNLLKIKKFAEECQREKHTLQGGAIAILYKGRVVYKTTFGKRIGNRQKITADTLFPLASVSKPISALSIAFLAEHSDFSFEKKIKLSCIGTDISMKDILSHSTGYDFSGNPQIERGFSRNALLSQISKQCPKCRVGECYFYSNAIFSLSEEFLKANELNLRNAVVAMSDRLGVNGIHMFPIKRNHAIAYPHLVIKRKGKRVLKSLPFPPYYPKTVSSAAGVFASLNGMIEILKLSSGYREDVISRKMLRYLYTPVVKSHSKDKRSGIKKYYAIGWRVGKTSNKKMIFHGGSINGVNSFIGFVPSAEVGIVILTNQQSSFPSKKGLKFCELFMH